MEGPELYYPSGEFSPDIEELSYASYDKQGILRPTITEGEIIVRSNPDAETDGSLDGLNRDIERAREITKDEEVYVNVYVSPSAIQEIMSGGEGIRKGINSYAEAIAETVVKKEKILVVPDALDSFIEKNNLTGEDRAAVVDAYQGYLDQIMSGVPEEQARAALEADLANSFGAEAAGSIMADIGIKTNSLAEKAKQIEAQQEQQLLAIQKNAEERNLTPQQAQENIVTGMELNSKLLLVEEFVTKGKDFTQENWGLLADTITSIDTNKVLDFLKSSGAISTPEEASKVEFALNSTKETFKTVGYGIKEGLDNMPQVEDYPNMAFGVLLYLAGNVNNAIGWHDNPASRYADKVNYAMAEGVVDTAYKAYENGSNLIEGIRDGDPEKTGQSAGGLILIAAELLPFNKGKQAASIVNDVKGVGKVVGDAKKLPNANLVVKADTPTVIGNAQVTDIYTGKTFIGNIDIAPTLERIQNGIKDTHKHDGFIFRNDGTGMLLPEKPLGYYKEYVHRTPGIDGVGPQRVIIGNGGEIYYTPDHYKSFIKIQ